MEWMEIIDDEKEQKRKRENKLRNSMKEMSFKTLNEAQF
jgi:DNA-binding HxlR family transcriptional regulator